VTVRHSGSAEFATSRPAGRSSASSWSSLSYRTHSASRPSRSRPSTATVEMCKLVSPLVHRHLDDYFSVSSTTFPRRVRHHGAMHAQCVSCSTPPMCTRCAQPRLCYDTSTMFRVPPTDGQQVNDVIRVLKHARFLMAGCRLFVRREASPNIDVREW